MNNFRKSAGLFRGRHFSTSNVGFKSRALKALKALKTLKALKALRALNALEAHKGLNSPVCALKP